MNRKAGIIILAVFIFFRSSSFALSPKPKTESLPELYQVLKVIDGDTLDILYHGQKERIRLLRIDTPERNQKGYHQAKKALKKLIAGRKVRLEFEVPGKLERGGYGRILAYIWVDETNINVEMVRLGWSRFWIKYGEGKYADEFREAEREARGAKKRVVGKKEKF